MYRHSERIAGAEGQCQRRLATARSARLPSAGIVPEAAADVASWGEGIDRRAADSIQHRAAHLVAPGTSHSLSVAAGIPRRLVEIPE